MPASLEAISKNFDRLKGDSELEAIVSKIKSDDPHERWAELIEKADKAGIADRIPGTVGRKFAVKYGTARTRRRVSTEVKLSPAASKLILEVYGYEINDVALTGPAAVVSADKKVLAITARAATRDKLVRACTDRSLTDGQRRKRRQVMGKVLRDMGEDMGEDFS